jgi:AcrR family transcriptional regulator
MPKIVDHDQQRVLLAEACFAVFARDGYSAASMRRLASAAGVSTGTLYHYFPDKQAIFVFLFEHITTRDELAIRADLPDGADLATRLSAVVRWVASHLAHLEAILGIVLEIRRQDSPEARALSAASVRRYREALGEVLDLREPALLVPAFSLFTGTLVQHMLDPEGVDFDRLEALVLALTAQLGVGLPAAR